MERKQPKEITKINPTKFIIKNPTKKISLRQKNVTIPLFSNKLILNL